MNYDLKILILSDSHGRTDLLRQIVMKEPPCDVMFHLGDAAADLSAVKGLLPPKIFSVKGNCDTSAFSTPPEAFCELGGKRIFFCHGHTKHVKSGLTSLMFAAREARADVCLFGHTHIPFYEFRGGIWFMNPGAVKDGRYGILELKPDGSVYPILKQM